MSNSELSNLKSKLLFWVIFLFAAVVRFKDLSTGLPLHTLYGENDTLQILLQMLQSGDLNPHHFDLPGLAYYLFLPFLYLFYILGSIGGGYSSIASVPADSFIFAGRLVCAAFGTASVYITYRLGKFFSERTALFAMAVFAGTPQHIEFSHMLRPEIPAIFFVLLAVHCSLLLIRSPSQTLYRLFGLFAGISFSMKYTIGLPLLPILLIVFWKQRKGTPKFWLLQSLLLFATVFIATNVFLFASPGPVPLLLGRINRLYLPGEDYYGKNIFVYYVDFLSRYNYWIPLMIVAFAGLLLSLFRGGGPAVAIFPVTVFLWLCSFQTRRVHGLLPLHPFLAIWAGLCVDEICKRLQRRQGSFLYQPALAFLICFLLYWPYHRTTVQAYLLSRLDNRSKAELWMTNRLPKGSRIAVLQYQQVELDPGFFQIENFSPADLIVSKKDFFWFRDHGFEYIVASSGQYMRYFTEGPSAMTYRDYYLKLFHDGSEQGTMVLDLITHPLLIPDYRIKVFSTHRLEYPPQFLAAVDGGPETVTYHLTHPGEVLSLPTGYFSLEFPAEQAAYSVTVKNTKLEETILQRNKSSATTHQKEGFPFAIFPIMQNSRFTLCSQSNPGLSSNQPVRFDWRGISGAPVLRRIAPTIQITGAQLSPLPPSGPFLPYLSFDPNQPIQLHCAIRNRTNGRITGYLEAFFSEIGEPQPWKNFETASGAQEFILEGGQTISIDAPVNTASLTGDHQLSFWIFTRQDLPFSPQDGGWFNKQIRVSDPQLGIHPIYGVSIP